MKDIKNKLIFGVLIPFVVLFGQNVVSCMAGINKETVETIGGVDGPTSIFTTSSLVIEIIVVVLLASCVILFLPKLKRWMYVLIGFVLQFGIFFLWFTFNGGTLWNS